MGSVLGFALYLFWGRKHWFEFAQEQLRAEILVELLNPSSNLFRFQFLDAMDQNF